MIIDSNMEADRDRPFGAHIDGLVAVETVAETRFNINPKAFCKSVIYSK